MPLTRTDIAGIPVADLASRYGTPLYVYDLQSTYDRLEELAPFEHVRYAQKAWSHVGLLDRLRRRGVLVDAVSAGEILRAFRAGYEPQGDPPPIVYTADLFDSAAIELVVEREIAVNCGSPDMIEQLGRVAPGRSITLRVNPGFGHGHSRKTNTGGPQSKHGIWHEGLPDALALASRYGLTVTGLHMHIGSGTDMQHLMQVCDAMYHAAIGVGESLRSISTGGGLPIPYRQGDPEVDIPRFHELWSATQTRLSRELGHRVALETEPGRFLVADAGYLIAEIRAIKSMGPNLFYIVDAGFHNLARPILYGAFHPMTIAPRETGAQRSMESVVIGGPLCESGDIFTQEEGGFVCHRALPRAEVGDYLVIEKAGAYGSVMASNYNSQPFAAEVWIEAGHDTLIRPRQPLEALFDDEIIPPVASDD